MDKKSFEELKQSLADMEAHAAGKKVKGVREVVKEVKPQTAVERGNNKTSQKTPGLAISLCNAPEHLDQNRPKMGTRSKPPKRLKP